MNFHTWISRPFESELFTQSDERMKLGPEQLAHLARQHKADSRAAMLQHLRLRVAAGQNLKEPNWELGNAVVNVFVTSEPEAEQKEQVSGRVAAGNTASGLVKLATS